MKTLVSLFMLLLVVTTAQAHKASDSYINIQVHEAQITGQWDIALRDLDHAIGLDTNADGAITWRELRTRHSEIAAYALARLHLTADTLNCTTTVKEQLVDQHSDGAYSVLRFSANCPAVVRQLNVDYRLFFDLDPQHRGLLQLSAQDNSESAIFAPAAPARSFILTAPNAWQQFSDYYRSGVGHIWMGFDHLLFLLALLLPSVLRRHAGRWIAVTPWHGAVTETAKIVTAFTVAHSVIIPMPVRHLNIY